MFKTLREDIDAALTRDPAAKSRLEILLCYPGLRALLFYRLGHAMWRRGWRLPARITSEVGRLLAGIEIHPGAKIGERFFIDHGMGVVIGETADIGDDVTLYHGVTLGGIAPSLDARAQADQKRHPTLGDRSIVGSGAQVLGPITVGADARVGANAVVVKDVPAGVTVVGIPARPAVARSVDKTREFVAYGTPTSEQADPMARAIDGLLARVGELAARVGQLEKQLEEKGEGLPRVGLEAGESTGETTQTGASKG